MDYYACEFYFTKCEGENEYEDWTLVSSIINLTDFIDFWSDIFNPFTEGEDVEALEDGDYHVFINGEVEFESDVDWESGIEEGHFVFEFDEVKWYKIPDSKKPEPVELKKES